MSKPAALLLITPQGQLTLKKNLINYGTEEQYYILCFKFLTSNFKNHKRNDYNFYFQEAKHYPFESYLHLLSTILNHQVLYLYLL